MKKLLIVLMLVLTLALSGCSQDELDGVQCVANRTTCEPNEVYYTQAEVDIIKEELQSQIDETNDNLINVITAINVLSERYTNEELDEGFEDVALWIEEHEQTPHITTCWLNNLLRDMLVAYNDGYTFDMNQYGVMFELKDGIYTGDSWTNQDLIDEYCTIESDIE